VSSRILFRSVELRSREIVDVLIGDGAVQDVAPRLDLDGVAEVEGRGGALLPGLHDHHIHLFATAAAASSVICGPPQVRTPEQLAIELAGVPGAGWVRGIGYDESVAGPLDRHVLDGLLAGRPIRVQHRGGSLWSLNSLAVEALNLADVKDAGVERDEAGRPTGRLWRMDHWLRHAISDDPTPPALSALGMRLASFGITGVTDASPGDAAALVSAGLRQRLWSMGEETAGAEVAPRKIVIGDHALPAIDDLAADIAAAHDEGRPVALHSVTRDSLLLLLAAFDDVGAIPGDRIEHAAVCPAEAIERIRYHGLTVVTQPSLLGTRGDDYLDTVDSDDVPHLWRYGTLLDAGIPVGLSSDAPYGDLDPWHTIAAAVTRTAPSGRVLGAAERVTAETALAGFLTDPGDPGGPPREVRIGAPADLVLLDSPLSEILDKPSATHVRTTFIGGYTAFGREGWRRM
jgi:predicted amidohydrolase YtcJ